MRPTWLAEGGLLIIAGLGLAFACYAGSRSDRFLDRAIRDQDRFRRRARLPAVDPARYRRSVRAGLIAGTLTGVLVAALGVAVLVKAG